MRCFDRCVWGREGRRSGTACDRLVSFKSYGERRRRDRRTKIRGRFCDISTRSVETRRRKYFAFNNDIINIIVKRDNVYRRVASSAVR